MTKRSGPRGHKILAAGTTALIAEPVLALTHQGAIGVIAGLFLGAAAYVAIENIEDTTGKSLALPTRTLRPPREKKERAASGKLSLGYRLVVGKSVREGLLEDEAQEDAPGDVEEPEDTYLPEEAEDLLELGADLHPHVNWFFSKRVSILGMSGSGKSNLVARLVECLGKYDAPLILLDLKPEYHKLCSRRYLVNATRADATSVTPQNARAIAREIMEKRRQVVLDLSSYEDSADAARVMIRLVLGVQAYQKACLTENIAPIPCTFVLEEAHEWLPESEAYSAIRGIKEADGQSLLGQLQRVFFNLATYGRSFGMGLITAAQRPANVDKRLISQAEWRFMLKAMDPSDLKTYRTYGATDEQIISLAPNKGEAYVVGPDGSRGVYRIKRRESPDEAKSPGVENLRRAAMSPSVPSVPAFRGQGAVERGNAAAGTFPTSAGTPWKQPVEPFPPAPAAWERSGEIAERRNAAEREPEVGYTPQEEQAVLRAYRELLAAGNGAEPSRRAVQRQMQAGGAVYQRLIRPVLDKHGLAIQKDAEEKYGNK